MNRPKSKEEARETLEQIASQLKRHNESIRTQYDISSEEQDENGSNRYIDKAKETARSVHKVNQQFTDIMQLAFSVVDNEQKIKGI